MLKCGKGGISISYTMACPPVHVDNPRALGNVLEGKNLLLPRARSVHL